MAPVIYTPVEGFTGTVAGVNFADGVGETDDPAALLYFGGAGYDIEPDEGDEGEELDESEGDEHEGGESEPDESEKDSTGSTGDESGDAESEGGEPNEAEGGESVSDGKPERPHPVQGNKAAWFEYLSAIKPDHGFDLEKAQRKELIAAANEVDGFTAE